MWIRKTLAGLGLALALGLVVSQNSPSSAAEDPKAAAKKAKLQKKLEAKKKVEVPKPPEPKDGGKPVVISKTPPAAPAKPMATAALAAMIDQGIDKGLRDSKINPSDRTTDTEFIRRVTLDITGVIPTLDRTVAFLDDKSSDKRARLIDELLSSPNYGKHMSDIWTTLMYPIDSDNRFITKVPLRDWLAEKFNANLHWDTMAYDLITATGEIDKNGAVGYMTANRGVDKITDSVGKLFLGVQIQCAQCHNHPFTHWKQAEYWGLAQFFYKVNVSDPRAALKTGGLVMVSEEGRINRKINPLPEASKSVAAKYLGAEEVKLNSSDPYRPALAQWICTPSNPFFAKAFVNRLWSQYFGHGFVNPVDDLSEENAPSHPELLVGLSKEFGGSGFDVKHMIRGICNSQAYQRSSKPLGDNRDDRTMFSHQGIKALTPEQLYDSLIAVLGAPGAMKDANGPKAVAMKGALQLPRDKFANFFMGSENSRPTDYEAGIPQALRLMNSPLMANGRLLLASNRMASIASPSTTHEKAIEKLYLGTLSRKPTADELKKLNEHVASQSDLKQAYSDVMWVLLNSGEFTLNR